LFSNDQVIFISAEDDNNNIINKLEKKAEIITVKYHVEIEIVRQLNSRIYSIHWSYQY